MYEKEQINNFKGGIAIGIGIGLLSGIASTLLIKNKQSLSADLILQRIKKAFLKEGPIEGSWISFEKQPVRKFAVHTEGYNGGITRLEDNRLVTYEFLADAKTGSVLDINAKFQVQVSQSRKPTCYLILNVLQYWLDNDQEDGIRDKRNGAGF